MVRASVIIRRALCLFIVACYQSTVVPSKVIVVCDQPDSAQPSRFITVEFVDLCQAFDSCYGTGIKVFILLLFACIDSEDQSADGKHSN